MAGDDRAGEAHFGGVWWFVIRRGHGAAPRSARRDAEARRGPHTEMSFNGWRAGAYMYTTGSPMGDSALRSDSGAHDGRPRRYVGLLIAILADPRPGPRLSCGREAMDGRGVRRLADWPSLSRLLLAWCGPPRPDFPASLAPAPGRRFGAAKGADLAPSSRPIGRPRRLTAGHERDSDPALTSTSTHRASATSKELLCSSHAGFAMNVHSRLSDSACGSASSVGDG